MHGTSRLIVGLCLLGCAACATDGITAPPLQPESELVASVADAEPTATEAEAVRPGPVLIFACSRSIIPPPAEPLYVVDGVVRGNVIDVDAENIETIEVIKGEVAAPVYGTRAANGVILITTRSGGR